MTSSIPPSRAFSRQVMSTKRAISSGESMAMYSVLASSCSAAFDIYARLAAGSNAFPRVFVHRQSIKEVVRVVDEVLRVVVEVVRVVGLNGEHRHCCISNSVTCSFRLGQRHACVLPRTAPLVLTVREPAAAARSEELATHGSRRKTRGGL